ncbi:MAG: hypothetical protein A2519_08240 [Candidatus Raymondbacteria bacterium RIFOXYD12_FULL_49_13]|uniref:Peptidase S9 prolyl oligopeptidase catalytic domain-containing protein n=1 Tax=Candidatus Raymondbacteria bacterium RIFOXYD12_FULL_49_13 TaxID=1817890 RepID=A0A1F7FI06_UNCRA|nr:MAG: hypothetical protein A2519_08240 [Candidatus Raymondbacteria bacterium RIFOXYD12_FULL_49_13]
MIAVCGIGDYTMGGPVMKQTPSPIKYDDTSIVAWNSDFSIVEIPSSMDSAVQKAYFRKSNAQDRKPLLISLHTWSGDYAQTDELTRYASAKDWNYIHPDFRGPNWTKKACCSKYVIADIDDAITYALQNALVDTDRIYVVGASGGGYATLSMFMKSRHSISRFSSWVPISDLVAWYHETVQRKSEFPYAQQIADCVGSTASGLNETEARERSPLYWETPRKKLERTKLNIFTGIYDGVKGSVPITHSIRFYNKVLKDLGVADSAYYVTNQETALLLETRKPLRNFGKIGDRYICLKKEYKNISLVIFTGEHEMLPAYAFESLR